MNKANKRTPWFWIGMTLFAQTFWGANPVLARYLQTVSLLPSMSLTAFSAFCALLLVGVIYLPRLHWRSFGNPKLLLFAVLVAARGITLILASRYTLAIYVQLITLLTPFLVALLSTAVLREKLPRYTIQAMLLSVFGALLIMGNSLAGAGEMSGANRSDLLGIAIALASSLLLAFYLVAIQGSVRDQIRDDTLLIVQLLTLTVVGGVLSILAGEDWSQWQNLTPFDWFIFALFVLGVKIGATLAQIGAIRHLGAAVVSSTMPWRLISALFLAALLLDERLNSLWQFLGVIIVLATVTWYLWRQRG